MCGRFALAIDNIEIGACYDFTFEVNIEKKYNISPGQEVLTILQDEGLKKHPEFMTWDFRPHWRIGVNTGNALINARSETISVKPSFRDAYRQGRCLIPASCFYEWRGKSPKQVYLIKPEIGFFDFAGIFSMVKNSEGKSYYTCCIVTREAPQSLQGIHHRAPVVISKQNHSIWLNHNLNTDSINSVLHQKDYPKIISYQISTKVNNAKNNYKGLWDRLYKK